MSAVHIVYIVPSSVCKVHQGKFTPFRHRLIGVLDPCVLLIGHSDFHMLWCIIYSLGMQEKLFKGYKM